MLACANRLPALVAAPISNFHARRCIDCCANHLRHVARERDARAGARSRQIFHVGAAIEKFFFGV